MAWIARFGSTDIVLDLLKCDPRCGGEVESCSCIILSMST